MTSQIATSIEGSQRRPLQVAVMFGGRSVEHEISVITALQLMLALDQERFFAVPVYIAPNGKWYTGERLLDRTFYAKVPGNLDQLTEVTLLPKPGVGGLLRLSPSNALDRITGRLDSKGIIPIDVYLPAFHGQYGEDGCIQGLFEMADVAYTGCNVPASAVAMNKYFCKIVSAAADVPVLPGRLVRRDDARRDIDQVCRDTLADSKLGGLPLFVKPCNLGSSIGVSRVKKEEELAPALAKVFRYDEEAIIEPCVTDIMEINVSVREHRGIEASVTEIPVSQTGVLSYEDKYLREGGKKTGQSQGMASLVRVIDPPDLAEDMKRSVVEYARRVFSILGGSGIARLDFIVNSKTRELYFNEINPLPGSVSFYLWIKSKPPRLYTQNLSDMIETALARKGSKDALDRFIGLRALKA